MEDKYFESTVAALVANHHEFTAVNLAGHDLKGGTDEANSVEASRPSIGNSDHRHSLTKLNSFYYTDRPSRLAEALAKNTHSTH